MPDVVVAAFYKFVALADPDALRAPVLAAMRANKVKGTVLLAGEGINGTVSGPREGLDRFLDWLRRDPRLADLEHKESIADEDPFYRSKVKLKREIVTLGVDTIDPVNSAGAYVEAADWNALVADPDVLLIDARNDYEVALGSFRGALDPRTKSFGEYPEFVRAHLDPAKHPKVAMFCTGGIRCEKASAYMRREGFSEVYHLKGGILKYLELVPEEHSLFKGDCFVFDQRVAVGHGLVPSGIQLCHGCRAPLGADDAVSPHYEEGVSCPKCFADLSEKSKASARERQKQVNLAKARNLPKPIGD
jgi:UPF0176 protein